MRAKNIMSGVEIIKPLSTYAQETVERTMMTEDDELYMTILEEDLKLTEEDRSTTSAIKDLDLERLRRKFMLQRRQIAAEQLTLIEKIEAIKIAKNDKWKLNNPSGFEDKSFIRKAIDRNL